MTLSIAALAVAGCMEADKPANEPEPTATGTEDSGGMEACPGVSDPECTTNNGCSPDEICSMCECVPKPAGCDFPEANCISDADCGQLESCETCLCTSRCDDDSACWNDSECAAGEICEEVLEALCECESPGDPDTSTDTGTDTGIGTDTSTDPECASGEASPVDSRGDTTTEIVVVGTTLQGELSGEPGACLGSLCDMTIMSNYPSTVQWNVFGASPAVQLTPATGEIEPGGTVTLSLESTQCDAPVDEMRGISFFDVTETLELGIVDLRFVTTLP